MSILAFAAAALALLTGCGEPAAPSAKPIARDPNLLVVYSACGLLPAVEAARDEFLAASPGKKVEITAGEPLELLARVQSGEVPDVFVCLGEAEIGELERQGHLDRGSRQTMGALGLVIAVPRGNPARVHSLKDLTAERVQRIAISIPGMTSPGSAAESELHRAGIWQSLQEKITVKQTALEVLQAVSKGEVDAALIYDPCLRRTVPEAPAVESEEAPETAESATDPVEVVSPATLDETPVTHIYASLHKRSPNGLLAQRFLRDLTAEIDGESDAEATAEPTEPAAETDPEAPA
ncbi:MAG: substrate-binding domain-containing protein [Armatimonadetes bacterium]|nr:substrate-binding domain-containing protein [Armatimonadota bacterium]